MHDLKPKLRTFRTALREDRSAGHVLAGVTGLYLLVYMMAVGDLAYTPAAGLGIRVAESLNVFAATGPFAFEAIAVVEAAFVTFLLSPLNLAVGGTLALLVGLNAALTFIAYRQPAVCDARPHETLLSTIPGLLAGSACCGPVILIVLGIQASAALISFFSILIPFAFILLLLTLLLNLRRIRPQV